MSRLQHHDPLFIILTYSINAIVQKRVYIIIAMAYRISYRLLLALSVLVCCNAIEQQHLRGRGNQKKERSLNGIFSTADRIVSPQQSYLKRMQTIPTVNNDLKSTYIQQCQSYLLDDSSIANDGIISQVDFANMLLNQCQQLAC